MGVSGRLYTQTALHKGLGYSAGLDRVKKEKISCYSKTDQVHQCTKYILFWNDTLPASYCISVHHQEFKTVHTATSTCQTDTADCLLASRQQYLFGCCMYSPELLVTHGKTVRNM